MPRSWFMAASWYSWRRSDELRTPRMITPAPCCRQNATVSPAHAATETLTQSEGTSWRSWSARSMGRRTAAYRR